MVGAKKNRYDSIVTSMDAIDRIYNREREKASAVDSNQLDSEMASFIQMENYRKYLKNKPKFSHKFKSIDVGISLAGLFGDSLDSEFMK